MPLTIAMSLPPASIKGCWRDLQPRRGLLLIATIRPFCEGYTRFAILHADVHASTLEIRVIVRCYVGTRGVMYAQATYLLFGAPLDRVPRSRLTVTIADDHAQPATESVDLS